jgi:hypothetical protein
LVLAQVDELVRAQLLVGLVAKVSDSKVVVRKAASQVDAPRAATSLRSQ